MISEMDLQEAIAECEGQRSPNANTCLKLAAFYTIRDQLFGRKNEKPDGQYISLEDAERILNMRSGFSHDSGIDQKTSVAISYSSGTEFSDAIHGKDIDAILPVLDEVMDSVRMVIPRLYDGAIRKLYDL